MKKHALIFFLICLGITSCEIDDFCSKGTTPRLIISFYDFDDPTEYKEVPMYAWAEEMENS